MRKLTIRRAKRFTACLAAMKVYLEDPAGSEVISGIPCRKLGELKNGAEATFEIGEEAARVFVIADKLSKNYCSDFYALPAGTEDITLCGQNEFNPAAGNAFRFSGNPDPAALQLRRDGTRKGLWILIAAVIAGAIAGVLIGTLLSGHSPAPKPFTAGALRLVLNEDFRESTPPEPFQNGFVSKNAAVYVLREDFTLAEGFSDLSLEEYGHVVLHNNELDVPLQTEGGLTWFENDFTDPDGNAFRAFYYLYKTDDAFYLVEFFTFRSRAEQFAPQIRAWAESVSFAS